MEMIGPKLQAAMTVHGAGSVLSILEALARTHALHTESTSHGYFIKCHYSRTTKPLSTATPSITSSTVGSGSSDTDASDSEGKIRRATLLSHKPRKYDAAAPTPGLHMQIVNANKDVGDIEAVSSTVVVHVLEGEGTKHCNDNEFHNIATMHASI